jgi:hypothetical protein
MLIELDSALIVSCTRQRMSFFVTDGRGYWFLMPLYDTAILVALYGYTGNRFDSVISLFGGL